MHARKAVAHGPHSDLRLAPAEGALHIQPDTLALHFQNADVSAILFAVVCPEMSLLCGGRDAGSAHPEYHCQSAQGCQHRADRCTDAPSLQGGPDPAQGRIRLRFRPHRHRLLHLFQLGAAGFTFGQMLFHQRVAGLTGDVLRIQRQQVADDITIHFHRILPSFFMAFHPNNAEKEKALQVSANFLQAQPFSCQNNPPLVWNRGQGFTLLLPSLKSMVSSSPSTPMACPRSTVCPRVTESSCRPYR